MKGNVTRRGKNSWRLKVDAGRDPGTGKRNTKYRTVHCANKTEAKTHLAEFITELKNGTYVEPSRLTVPDYLERWLEDYARTAVSPKTFERYGELLRLYVTPHLSAVLLSKLDPLAIQAMYGRLLSGGRCDGNGGLAPQTVKHVHRVLSKALRQAVRWRLLNINPADAVDPPKVEETEVQVLDQGQVKALLAAAEGGALYAPIVLVLNTGLRRGELLALRWKDIDLDGASLSVQQSLEQTKDGLRFKAPKTKRGRRSITLPSATVDMLRRHKVEQAKARLQMGPDYTDRGLVFARYDGEPLNPRNFTKEFYRLRKRANLGAITFHGLRHTHITMLMQQNVHPKVASERAGHSSVSITLDIYSHAVPSLQEDAARTMDELFRNITSQ